MILNDNNEPFHNKIKIQNHIKMWGRSGSKKITH